MLALSHMEDEELVRGLCARAGAGYCPGLEAYAAFDGGRTAGFCLFSREGKELVFLTCSWDRELGIGLCDGLLRAAMDHACRQGAVKAGFSDSFPQELLAELIRLGYSAAPFDMEEFFTGCRHCGGM